MNEADGGDRNQARPTDIRLSADRLTLTMEWDDGRRDALPAALLRENCQAAGEKRLRLIGLDAPARPGLTIAAVRAVGHYAVNIAFSDGNDRGIYPWALLRTLAEREAPHAENAIP